MKRRQGQKTIGIIALIMALGCGALGCAGVRTVAEGASPAASVAPSAQPAAASMPQMLTLATATPAPEEAAATPGPTATPAPQKASATIGAVGDIMVMPSQLAGAYIEETGGYDFMRSFTGVQKMFSSIDLMCGNLEGAIAGAEIGYANGRTDTEGRIKFNAPDEFAYNLRQAGFDCLTTANNHAGDCDASGVVNTIRTLRAAGLLQTGTFETLADRETPLVVERNGIKIGVLATTTVINGSSNMSRAEKNEMFSRMQNFEQIEAEIAASRAAGAEFIVMFAHWDEEYETRPSGSTRKYADQLLAAGVDAIIGAHPHVVQPFEYRTVTRADGSEYTGLVAYSLGNFLANMSGECSYGMLLQLTVERDGQGRVALAEAAYMPTLCFSEELPDPTEEKPNRTRTVHQLVPALADTTGIVSHDTLDEKEQALVKKAREHVLKVCGTEIVPVMEDACWIN